MISTDAPISTNATTDAAQVARQARACAAALPTLGRQLREVIGQVEAAVVSVCGNFAGIVHEAQAAAGLVANEAGSTDTSVAHTVAEIRNILTAMLNRIEASSVTSAATVERMDRLEQQFRDLNSVLEQIDNVARQSRVLALNGRIEAAKAREHGSAFAVVARETASMASQAMEANATIRKQIGRIVGELNCASDELQQRAKADAQQAANSRVEVDAALNAISAADDQQRQLLDISKQRNERLTAEVSRAVVTMQFQDTVSQRVGHVVDTLAEMEVALNAALAGNGESLAASGDWSQRMAASYTMAAERDVLSARAHDDSTADNIELF